MMRVKMEGSSSSSSYPASAMAVAAAFALSAGCSLFLLTYLSSCSRDKAQAANSSKSVKINPCIRTTSSTSAVKGVRKHVRFAGVKEIDHENKKLKTAKTSAGKSPRQRKQRASDLPENWRRLYCGINRYRSQQATLLIYA